MRVEFNGVCNKGIKRDTNQDRLYMKTRANTTLLVIADGMGGHVHGERASQQIVTELKNWYEAFDESAYMGDFNRMLSAINDRLQQANKDIYSFYDKNTVCGSTVVVIFIYQDNYAVLWAGDSRAYIQKGWGFKQLTVDDVWENQAQIKANLNKRMIKESVNRGKLVNSIGIYDTANINQLAGRIKQGTKFLICSDGLYKMCSDKEIRKMMERYNGNEGGDLLMQEYLKSVYDKGAVDNVSFIVAICN
jgi:protein phosphatase